MSHVKQNLDSKNVEPIRSKGLSESFRAEKAMLQTIKHSILEEQESRADEFMLSAAIAESIKDAIAESGLSRENVVDLINSYFGRSKRAAASDFPTCRNPLTINTFNNYLSKPAACPIPAYYLFAIQRVTKSLAPSRTLALSAGGHVVSGKEAAQMVFGRLEVQISEAKQLQQQIMTENGLKWLN